MSKYHSRKTVVDGITFDSKAEAERYSDLKLLERAGFISSLVLQPEFELQPKFHKNGKTYRSITYRADFSYTEQGKTIIEDVKGMETKEFKLKRKLFEYRYPDLTIREIKA